MPVWDVHSNRDLRESRDAMQRDRLLETYGPWALVTGASSGIGEAFARLLAERGFSLVITARRQTRLETLARELAEKHRVTVDVVAADLSAPDFLDVLTPALANRDIGLLVSNAGLGMKGDHAEKSADELTRLLHTNCLALLLLTRHFIPVLQARRRGGMILVGSMEAMLGFPHSATYAASKAFVKSLGEGLWGELAPSGIDVLVCSPGPTDTAMLRAAGVDPSRMPGVMTPRQVAAEALAHVDRGPHLQHGWLNRMLVRFLTWIPRRAAIRMVGYGIKRNLDRMQ
jgi:short-subunit dehydrogenase